MSYSIHKNTYAWNIRKKIFVFPSYKKCRLYKYIKQIYKMYYSELNNL